MNEKPEEGEIDLRGEEYRAMARFALGSVRQVPWTCVWEDGFCTQHPDCHGG